MRRALLVLALVVLLPALFVRSYSLPPAPDRRGGTTILLSVPNRPLFGSPRADCVDTPEDGSVIACLIASVNRSREEGIPLLSLPFSPTAYGLSERVALLGRDEAAGKAQLARIARFGW
ncbi:hypothetical protein FV226_12720 [Methylobacterium sp. WL12]|uniref:hypothetical protein n=1 Tax=Methylobacterium sp. WL12 TaxID=2603890 RepID=UPI0011C8FA52|nr:hypothetical protein [Methylobacterium sp. WL12]TXM72241.1 hypothetical protein FV226_12720 [Methylobacterium sp. WL12]